jgi:hypothetical protein
MPEAPPPVPEQAVLAVAWVVRANRAYPSVVALATTTAVAAAVALPGILVMEGMLGRIPALV